MIDLSVLRAITAAGATGAVVLAAVEAMVADQSHGSAGGPAVAVVQHSPPAAAATAGRARPSPLSSTERSRMRRDRQHATLHATLHALPPVASQPIVVEMPADTRACDQPNRHEICAVERKKEEIEGGGGAHARSILTPEAHTLADEFLTAIGVVPQDAHFYGMAGATYAAQMWIDRGYDRPLVLATAADVRARHGPKPLTYFMRSIETAQLGQRERTQREMPLFGAISGSQRHDRTSANQRGGSLVQAGNERIAELFALRRGAADRREEDGTGEGGRALDLRANPQGRCG